MSGTADVVHYHINDDKWRITPDGNPRGYIQPQKLRELWFHTGTVCNLNCSFCFEGSAPGNDRLQMITLNDAAPIMEEAEELGVSQFSFTGGEPFMNPEMTAILEKALDINPCLVLTNATKPLLNRLDSIAKLSDRRNSLSFRVSLDHPDEMKHDEGRGKGNFALSLKMMSELHKMGFKVTAARKQPTGADSAMDAAYKKIFSDAGLPEDIGMVSFPELLRPFSSPEVPHITETCMTTYKTQTEREQFMCSYSKMAVKKDGRMRIYACTLVDDDNDYDFGGTLKEAMKVRVMLCHHRCFSCFASGTSCSG